jgi:hypothetical protein
LSSSPRFFPNTSLLLYHPLQFRLIILMMDKNLTLLCILMKN